jgi:hypothetical protein
MVDILESIAALEKAIREPKTIENVSSWLDWCQIIETSIMVDHRATAHEKQEVARLKQAVSNAILYMQKTFIFPDARLISAVLIGLRASIEKRTTRPNG